MPIQRIKKITSFLLTFFLLLSDLARANPALLSGAQMEAKPALEISLPPELGWVRETYLPDKSNQPFIFHLQTVHADYENALKTSEIIHFLESKYKAKLLFVEGASGRLHSEFLQFFPDLKMNAQMLDQLAQKGELTGVDLSLSGNQNKTEAMGIESLVFYRAAFRDFKKVISHLTQSEGVIAERKRQLDTQASKVFSREFRRLVDTWQTYEANHRDFNAVVRFLKEEAKSELDIDFENPFSQFEWPGLTRLVLLSELERRVDAVRYDKEKEKLKAWLSGKGIPTDFMQNLESKRLKSPRSVYEQFLKITYPLGFRFKDYPQITYQTASQVLQGELDAQTLFSEFDKLFEKLFHAKAKKEEELTLLNRYKKLLLLQKLLRLELTRDEWEQVKKRRLSDKLQKEIPILAEAIDFYRLCEEREKAFYQRLSREMSARHEKMAILVTGGFHREGMAHLFQEKGIGYATIQPQISGEMSSTLYHQIMLGKAHIEKPEFLLPRNILNQIDSARVQSELRTVEETVQEMGKSFSSDERARLKSQSSYFRDRYQTSSIIAPASQASQLRRSEMRTSNPWEKGVSYGAYLGGKFRSKLLPIPEKTRAKIEKYLQPFAFWSPERGIEIKSEHKKSKNGFVQQLVAYIEKRKSIIEENIKRLQAKLGRPVIIALHSEGMMYEEYDYRLKLALSLDIDYKSQKKAKIEGEFLSFRDQKETIHLPLGFFIPSMDPELQGELAYEAALAATEQDRPAILSKLRGHTRQVIFGSPLFAFPNSQEIQTQFPFEKTVPLLEHVGRFENSWSVVGRDDRIQSRQINPDKESAGKQVILEKVSHNFAPAAASEPDLLLRHLQQWFPPNIAMAITDFVKYGRAKNLGDTALGNWILAIRHSLVMADFNAYEPLYFLSAENLISSLIGSLAPQDWEILSKFQDTAVNFEALIQKILREKDILFLQSDRQHIRDFIPLLEAENTLPSKTLVGFPLVERGNLKDSYGLWSSSVRRKKISWKGIAEAVNHFIATGSGAKLRAFIINPKLITSLEDQEKGLKELLTHFKALRDLYLSGANIHYFPDFDINTMEKVADRQELESRFRDYLEQLKTYQSEINASKIVIAHKLPKTGYSGDAAGRMQKPSRNDPDLFDQLLKSKDFFDRARVASAVHVTYDLNGDFFAPLYKILTHWQGNSFGALVDPLIADMPISLWPQRGAAYVFGNYNYAFLTIKKRPDRGGDQTWGLEPEPGEALDAKKEVALAPRSEMRSHANQSYRYLLEVGNRAQTVLDDYLAAVKVGNYEKADEIEKSINGLHQIALTDPAAIPAPGPESNLYRSASWVKEKIEAIKNATHRERTLSKINITPGETRERLQQSKGRQEGYLNTYPFRRSSHQEVHRDYQSYSKAQKLEVLKVLLPLLAKLEDMPIEGAFYDDRVGLLIAIQSQLGLYNLAKQTIADTLSQKKDLLTPVNQETHGEAVTRFKSENSLKLADAELRAGRFDKVHEWLVPTRDHFEADKVIDRTEKAIDILGRAGYLKEIISFLEHEWSAWWNSRRRIQIAQLLARANLFDAALVLISMNTSAEDQFDAKIEIGKAMAKAGNSDGVRRILSEIIDDGKAAISQTERWQVLKRISSLVEIASLQNAIGIEKNEILHTLKQAEDVTLHLEQLDQFHPSLSLAVQYAKFDQNKAKGLVQKAKEIFLFSFSRVSHSDYGEQGFISIFDVMLELSMYPEAQSLLDEYKEIREREVKRHQRHWGDPAGEAYEKLMSHWQDQYRLWQKMIDARHGNLKPPMSMAEEIYFDLNAAAIGSHITSIKPDIFLSATTIVQRINQDLKSRRSDRNALEHIVWNLLQYLSESNPDETRALVKDLINEFIREEGEKAVDFENSIFRFLLSDLCRAVYENPVEHREAVIRLFKGHLSHPYSTRPPLLDIHTLFYFIQRAFGMGSGSSVGSTRGALDKNKGFIIALLDQELAENKSQYGKLKSDNDRLHFEHLIQERNKNLLFVFNEMFQTLDQLFQWPIVLLAAGLNFRNLTLGGRELVMSLALEKYEKENDLAALFPWLQDKVIPSITILESITGRAYGLLHTGGETHEAFSRDKANQVQRAHRANLIRSMSFKETPIKLSGESEGNFELNPYPSTYFTFTMLMRQWEQMGILDPTKGYHLSIDTQLDNEGLRIFIPSFFIGYPENLSVSLPLLPGEGGMGFPGLSNLDEGNTVNPENGLLEGTQINWYQRPLGLKEPSKGDFFRLYPQDIKRLFFLVEGASIYSGGNHRLKDSLLQETIKARYEDLVNALNRFYVERLHLSPDERIYITGENYDGNRHPYPDGEIHGRIRLLRDKGLALHKQELEEIFLKYIADIKALLYPRGSLKAEVIQMIEEGTLKFDGLFSYLQALEKQGNTEAQEILRQAVPIRSEVRNENFPLAEINFNTVGTWISEHPTLSVLATLGILGLTASIFIYRKFWQNAETKKSETSQSFDWKIFGNTLNESDKKQLVELLLHLPAADRKKMARDIQGAYQYFEHRAPYEKRPYATDAPKEMIRWIINLTPEEKTLLRRFFLQLESRGKTSFQWDLAKASLLPKTERMGFLRKEIETSRKYAQRKERQTQLLTAERNDGTKIHYSLYSDIKEPTVQSDIFAFADDVVLALVDRGITAWKLEFSDYTLRLVSPEGEVMRGKGEWNSFDLRIEDNEGNPALYSAFDIATKQFTDFKPFASRSEMRTFSEIKFDRIGSEQIVFHEKGLPHIQVTVRKISTGEFEYGTNYSKELRKAVVLISTWGKGNLAVTLDGGEFGLPNEQWHIVLSGFQPGQVHLIRALKENPPLNWDWAETEDLKQVVSRQLTRFEELFAEIRTFSESTIKGTLLEGLSNLSTGYIFDDFEIPYWGLGIHREEEKRQRRQNEYKERLSEIVQEANEWAAHLEFLRLHLKDGGNQDQAQLIQTAQLLTDEMRKAEHYLGEMRLSDGWMQKFLAVQQDSKTDMTDWGPSFFINKLRQHRDRAFSLRVLHHLIKRFQIYGIPEDKLQGRLRQDPELGRFIENADRFLKDYGELPVDVSNSLLKDILQKLWETDSFYQWQKTGLESRPEFIDVYPLLSQLLTQVSRSEMRSDEEEIDKMLEGLGVEIKETGDEAEEWEAPPDVREKPLAEYLQELRQTKAVYGPDNPGEFQRTYEYVSGILKRLLTAAGFRPEEHPLYFVDEHKENLWLRRKEPEVFVTLGLLRFYAKYKLSEDSLTFLIAHEIVHKLQFAEKVPRSSEYEWLHRIAQDYVDEYDAEIRAIRIVADAGYSIQDVEAFLDKLREQLKGKGRFEDFSYFGGHPQIVKRMDRIRQIRDNGRWPETSKAAPHPLPDYFVQEAQQLSSRRHRWQQAQQVSQPEKLVELIPQAENFNDLFFILWAGMGQLPRRFLKNEETSRTIEQAVNTKLQSLAIWPAHLQGDENAGKLGRSLAAALFARVMFRTVLIDMRRFKEKKLFTGFNALLEQATSPDDIMDLIMSSVNLPMPQHVEMGEETPDKTKTAFYTYHARWTEETQRGKRFRFGWRVTEIPGWFYQWEHFLGRSLLTPTEYFYFNGREITSSFWIKAITWVQKIANSVLTRFKKKQVEWIQKRERDPVAHWNSQDLIKVFKIASSRTWKVGHFGMRHGTAPGLDQWLFQMVNTHPELIRGMDAATFKEFVELTNQVGFQSGPHLSSNKSDRMAVLSKLAYEVATQDPQKQEFLRGRVLQGHWWGDDEQVLNQSLKAFPHDWFFMVPGEQQEGLAFAQGKLKALLAFLDSPAFTRSVGEMLLGDDNVLRAVARLLTKSKLSQLEELQIMIQFVESKWYRDHYTFHRKIGRGFSEDDEEGEEVDELWTPSFLKDPSPEIEAHVNQTLETGLGHGPWHDLSFTGRFIFFAYLKGIYTLPSDWERWSSEVEKWSPVQILALKKVIEKTTKRPYSELDKEEEEEEENDPMGMRSFPKRETKEEFLLRLGLLGLLKEHGIDPAAFIPPLLLDKNAPAGALAFAEQFGEIRIRHADDMNPRIETVRDAFSAYLGQFLRPLQVTRLSLEPEGQKAILKLFAYLLEAAKKSKRSEVRASDWVDSIIKWLPPTSYRNWALYFVFVDKFLGGQLGIKLDRKRIADPAYFQELWRNLSPSNQEAVSRFAQEKILPSLVEDKRLKAMNVGMIGRHFTRDSDEEDKKEIQKFNEKKYQEERGQYQDARFFVPGGPDSQLDLVFGRLLFAPFAAKITDPAVSLEELVERLAVFYPRPSPERDKWFYQIAQHSKANLQIWEKIIPLAKSHWILQRVSLKALHAVRKIKTTVTIADELELIEKWFPKATTVRDGLLDDVIQEKVETLDELNQVEAKFLLPPLSDKRVVGDQAVAIAGYDLLHLLVDRTEPKTKNDYLFWLLLGEGKPQSAKDEEFLLHLNLDGFKEEVEKARTEEVSAVRKTKDRILGLLLDGENGILHDEQATQELFQKLLNRWLPNKTRFDKVIRTVVDSLIHLASRLRKREILISLLAGSESLHDREGQPEELQAKVTRRILEAFDLVGIKGGQVLSSSALATWMPVVMQKELAELQDRAERIDKGVSLRFLDQVYQGKLQEHFPRLGKSIGSASTSVVYEATHVSGRKAALKHIRPKARNRTVQDLEWVKQLPAEIQKRLKEQNLEVEDWVFPYLERLIGRLEHMVLPELYLDQEAKNLRGFSDRLKKRNSPFKIPEVIENPGDDVLAMELIEKPVPISNQEVLTSRGVSAQNTRMEVAQEIITEINEGHYQGDPHPRNFLVDSAGARWMIDFGAAYKLSETQRKFLMDLIAALAIGGESKPLIQNFFGEKADGALLNEIDGIAKQQYSLQGRVTKVLLALDKKEILPDELALAQRVLLQGGYLFEGLGLWDLARIALQAQVRRSEMRSAAKSREHFSSLAKEDNADRPLLPFVLEMNRRGIGTWEAHWGGPQSAKKYPADQNFIKVNGDYLKDETREELKKRGYILREFLGKYDNVFIGFSRNAADSPEETARILERWKEIMTAIPIQGESLLLGEEPFSHPEWLEISRAEARSSQSGQNPAVKGDAKTQPLEKRIKQILEKINEPDYGDPFFNVLNRLYSKHYPSPKESAIGTIMERTGREFNISLSSLPAVSLTDFTLTPTYQNESRRGEIFQAIRKDNVLRSEVRIDNLKLNAMPEISAFRLLQLSTIGIDGAMLLTSQGPGLLFARDGTLGMAGIDWPPGIKTDFRDYLRDSVLRNFGNRGTIIDWRQVPAFSILAENQSANTEPVKIVRIYDHIPQIDRPELQILADLLAHNKNAQLFLQVQGGAASELARLESGVRREILKKRKAIGVESKGVNVKVVSTAAVCDGCSAAAYLKGLRVSSLRTLVYGNDAGELNALFSSIPPDKRDNALFVRNDAAHTGHDELKEANAILAALDQLFSPNPMPPRVVSVLALLGERIALAQQLETLVKQAA